MLSGFVCTALIALALAACGMTSATTESIRKTFPAIQAKQDDTKCQSLGFKPGTEGYQQCRFRLKTHGSYDRFCERGEIAAAHGTDV
jgi:hypothetical protein